MGNVLNPVDANIYNWLVIEKDKIAAIGMGNKYSQFAEFCDGIIDAKGSTALPGFYDSYINWFPIFLE